jgi:hypothetical protein
MAPVLHEAHGSERSLSGLAREIDQVVEDGLGIRREGTLPAFTAWRRGVLPSTRHFHCPDRSKRISELYL